MNKRNACRSFLLAIALMPLCNAIARNGDNKEQQQGKALWEIGAADKRFDEFAFLPTRGVRFVKDGFFIVGRSDASKDWPYAQPGPDDSWAGNSVHTNTIVFALKGEPAGGDYKLQLDLADVGPHEVKLHIIVNGHVIEQKLAAGAAKSIWGNAGLGAPVSSSVSVPQAFLKSGNNRIDIATIEGSWIVYDHIGFSAPATAMLQIVGVSTELLETKALAFIERKEGKLLQPVRLQILNTGDAVVAAVKVQGLASQTIQLQPGVSGKEILLPAVTKDSTVNLTIEVPSRETILATASLQRVPQMTVYILPHSHNDIGYTEIQSAVEQKQINNLLKGIAYADRTKNYPEGARFVWNLEGVYAADLFLNRMNEQNKQAFAGAVKSGSVALNGMYVNTLTGLCRPEELLQLFSYSNQLAAKFGTDVKSAMISDVPGYTWGTVSAMAQAGIRYFSAAPNNFDRIGDILVKWEDKPFWWQSPSGKEKVLVWIPYRGYALSHGLPNGLTREFVDNYMHVLAEKKFPYDISYIRWSGHGDNAEPDMSICDFVKDWNSKYAWPHFVISSTTKAFEAFDQKYGKDLPVETGDWTGYWEDGAGSSALETTQNRHSSSRLTQAGALWAMIDPAQYPKERFHEAWKNVILYSEHTWGADESVTRPLTQKTQEQWVFKKAYATQADSISRNLVTAALVQTPGKEVATAIDIFNTHSWAQTGLVLLDAKEYANGDLIKDANGAIQPSQRLSTGQLAFVAKDIPPLASRRFFISAGTASANASDNVKADQSGMDNGIVALKLNPRTGAINSLTYKGVNNEFVDSSKGEGLSDYLFLEGSDVTRLQKITSATIRVKEQGPVLATLVVETTAPGCAKFSREIRLVNGLDQVEIVNLLDKKPAELNPYPGDYGWANLKGKESLNIAFPFHVPGGEIKLGLPMAIMRPEKDQLPSACKNWLEVGDWADVSNEQWGISWVSPDAPLVEIGEISANLLGGQTNPAVWRKTIEPGTTIYSWALNNHWETNYRAYQLGHISFKYVVRPHKGYDPVAVTRFATGYAEPLIVAPAKGDRRDASLFRLSDATVTVLSLKPTQDKKAWLINLFNPSSSPVTTSLQWAKPVGQTTKSNTSEQRGALLGKTFTVSAQEVVTLRVEKL